MNGPKWIDDLVKEHPCVIIGEVKTMSPYGFKTEASLYEALEYVESISDIISIHTNSWWGGSWEWLTEVRKLTKKLILAKGFHDTKYDVEKALDLGSNHVLTVGWWYPDIRCWHECGSIQEVDDSRASWVVWNSRNPRTGEKRPNSFDTVRSYRRGKLCQASGIKKRSDIQDRADAILIGEALYNT